MVEFEISANKLYFVLSILIIIMAGAVVYAYDSGGPATILGHSADEIDWSEQIDQMFVWDLTISSSLLDLETPNNEGLIFAEEGIEVTGTVSGDEISADEIIQSPIIMAEEFCVGNYALAFAECISSWDEVIPGPIVGTNTWTSEGLESTKIDWNGYAFEWASVGTIYSDYNTENPTCSESYAGRYRYRVVDDGGPLYWTKNFCHYNNAPVYQWSNVWILIEDPLEIKTPAYRNRILYYSDINLNIDTDRITSVKIIMKSPDLSCSACGVEGAGAWVCESITCPIN